MSKVSLSTNVDLQNYATRIGTVAKAFNPMGIEIFSLAKNYPGGYPLELPEQEKTLEGASVISKELARKVGKAFREYGIRKIQFHYPWEKEILDRHGHDIALTFNFCDIVLEESGAEQLTINHHNLVKYPTPSEAKISGAEFRESILDALDTRTLIVKGIKKSCGSRCKLIAENNPSCGIELDKKTGEYLVDNVDFVPEDFLDREGIEGMNLDYPHAWTVVAYFQGKAFEYEGPRSTENLEWCRRHYGGVPESAKSMENFIRKVAPKVEWMHISDEANPYAHKGLHVGEGNVDFKECADLLEKYLPKETPATIEVKDGHTEVGFKRILEHDWPFLKKLFD